MFSALLPSPMPFPSPLIRAADESLAALLAGPLGDFRHPDGEPALVPADSLSWRIFKNPVSLFIGGVAAVILELAHPGVRAGVWEHSSFRRNPEQRLQRTGLAAMVTVYGAHSVAEAMIAGVRRLHERVNGTLPNGETYSADDPDLLDWVQATASFGFATAYSVFVRELKGGELDQLYQEAQPAARLYGAARAPASEAELEALFYALGDRLEASPIVFEFLDLMRASHSLPGLLRGLQPLLLRAAVTITPDWVRDILGLTDAYALRPWEMPIVREAARMSGKVLLPSSPPVQACLRLGLPHDYLYR